MQCIWSTAAKSRVWSNIRIRRTASLKLAGGHDPWCLRTLQTAALPLNPDFTNAHSSDKPTPQASVFAYQDLFSKSLTAPQVSRAAAQAVRMCSPREALYIVNSLHFSNFPAHQREGGLSRPTQQDVQVLPAALHALPLQPIDFGRSVSPRLASHSFLHLLIRNGLPDKAAKYAELMMQQGIRIRTGTTEAIVRSLCDSGSLFHVAGLVQKLKHRAAFSHKISDVPSSASHSGIRAAQSILSYARRFGQQRTKRMYENLIYACLMQGEIIVASLLFVLLVKDWQSYQARKDARDQECISNQINDADVVQTRLDMWSSDGIVNGPLIKDATSFPPGYLRLKPPHPETRMLALTTEGIGSVFVPELDDPGGDDGLQQSLQALANLVSLVDNTEVQLPHLSTLFKVLYKTPKTNHTVQVWRRGKTLSVKAYPHFHDFLYRTIVSLKSAKHTTPLIDRRACNSLLHYALRHRLSPSLASDVLHYLCTHFSPDIVTVNTLLRSGTLLRRMDISELALDILRQSSDIAELLNDRIDRPPQSHTSKLPLHPRMERAKQRLQQQSLDVPKSFESLSVTSEVQTLLAYITHLISTGRPHEVPDLLFKILPELRMIDHPSWGNVSIKERRRPHKKSRWAYLRRAVQLGPHFFAVIINGLVKAGRTGLAERVWILAQEAERASWHPEFMPDVEPWVLSIHAYTSMIQCYTAEAGRSHLPSSQIDEMGVWKPKHKPWAFGWARYIYKRGKLLKQPLSRREAGREMTGMLFRTMLSGCHQVISSLLKLRDAESQIAKVQAAAPVPDARFFNAILQLFKSDSSHGKAKSHQRIFARSMKKFVQERVFPRHWSPLLQEVGQAMLASGYPIPIAYRHLFIGRLPEATRDSERRRTLRIAPFAYPERGARWYSPRRIPTAKTRGLPLRRRHKYFGLRATPDKSEKTFM
ncbi:hypothetical protein BDW22DRAFT_1367137 [Trametopsis cervina]|nr:hypothetical protein BDW22DRAFT_1367137 [Trametopsis cervina]